MGLLAGPIEVFLGSHMSILFRIRIPEAYKLDVCTASCDNSYVGNRPNMDRISQLPEGLMLEVLLRLPPKDSARLKITSKTWNSLPVCYFNNHLSFDWMKEDNSVSSMDQYVRKVHELHPKNIFHSFSLRASFDLGTEPQTEILRICDSHINSWMELATKHCLNQLQLYFSFRRREQYRFPIADFDFGSLVVLTLEDCILEKSGQPKKMSCLKELRLICVDFSRLSVADMLSMCPSLETLALTFCYNIYYLRLCGFPKLKQVFLTPRYYWPSHFDEYEYSYQIEADNLETLHLHPYDPWCQCPSTCQCFPPMDLEAVKCCNLKELSILTPESYINHQYVTKLTRKFPLLEILTLEACYESPNLLISSHQLKKLTLVFGSFPIQEVSLDTPNLASCTYINDKIHPQQFLVNSTKLEELKLRLFLSDFPKGLDFFIPLRKLFEDLAALERSTVSITTSKIKFSLKLLREEASVAETMQLKLKVKQRDSFRWEKPGYCISTFLDNLLWSCQPVVISITKNKWILQAICKKFRSWKENSPCCRDYGIKCWRHSLKSFEIQDMDGRRDTDLSIQARHILGVDSVTFALEWLTPRKSID